ncbi:MAG: HAD-IA family hydrolase [Thainema sp.]
MPSNLSTQSVSSLKAIDFATNNRPQVIFLDAVGTLFGVRDSVGIAYCQIAERFGVQADAEQVNTAFITSFRAAPSMAFPDAHADEIPQQEYDWWAAIAVQTFEQVGLLDQFADFDAFFSDLYEHFKTAKPWFVYPDVWEALKHWQQQGIPLGVLSNFDSRLYPVLEALELAPWFDSVTISTEVGAAKPDAKVFETAIAKHNCPPAAALHIGDSHSMDYEGACAAGLQAIWLDRT